MVAFERFLFVEGLTDEAVTYCVKRILTSSESERKLYRLVFTM
jgi:hypothetical protein